MRHAGSVSVGRRSGAWPRPRRRAESEIDLCLRKDVEHAELRALDPASGRAFPQQVSARLSWFPGSQGESGASSGDAVGSRRIFDSRRAQRLPVLAGIQAEECMTQMAEHTVADTDPGTMQPGSGSGAAPNADLFVHNPQTL
jgi:hypothetical protein